jgi:hypothetical protein
MTPTASCILRGVSGAPLRPTFRPVVTPSLHQTSDFENSRGRAGFSAHPPHASGGSALQRCVAVMVLLAGSAAFVGMVIWPLVNIVLG